MIQLRLVCYVPVLGRHRLVEGYCNNSELHLHKNKHIYNLANILNILRGNRKSYANATKVTLSLHKYKYEQWISVFSFVLNTGQHSRNWKQVNRIKSHFRVNNFYRVIRKFAVNIKIVIMSNEHSIRVRASNSITSENHEFFYVHYVWNTGDFKTIKSVLIV